jgi:hypothetical protein
LQFGGSLQLWWLFERLQLVVGQGAEIDVVAFGMAFISYHFIFPAPIRGCRVALPFGNSTLQGTIPMLNSKIM